MTKPTSPEEMRPALRNRGPPGLTCVGVGLLQEVGASVHVCECADAQAVGGVQLGLQKVTAVLPNVHELQQAGCREQHLQEKAIV